MKKTDNAGDWLKKVEESGYKMSQEQKEEYCRMHKESYEGRVEELRNSFIDLLNVISNYFRDIYTWLKRKIS